MSLSVAFHQLMPPILYLGTQLDMKSFTLSLNSFFVQHKYVGGCRFACVPWPRHGHRQRRVEYEIYKFHVNSVCVTAFTVE